MKEIKIEIIVKTQDWNNIEVNLKNDSQNLNWDVIEKKVNYDDQDSKIKCGNLDDIQLDDEKDDEIQEPIDLLVIKNLSKSDFTNILEILITFAMVDDIIWKSEENVINNFIILNWLHRFTINLEEIIRNYAKKNNEYDKINIIDILSKELLHLSSIDKQKILQWILLVIWADWIEQQREKDLFKKFTQNWWMNKFFEFN